MATAFTPLPAFGGGILIGLAAVLLMLGLGRILGATGIMGGVIFPESRREFGWRAAMVLGMAMAPGLIVLVTGAWPALDVPVSPLMVAIGGIIGGIGASFGAGCPSGHGVCGLSRLSLRSIVAVPTFMATAALTVFVIRHVIGG